MTKTKIIKVKTVPTKNLLLSYHRRQFGWFKSLCEWTDNSCDAGAKNINFRIRPREIEFSDDGRGMTTQAIRALFTLGDHHEYDTTQTGEFGVGWKDAALWLWGEIEILSIARGKRRRAHVDLDEWIKDPEWEIPVAEDSCSSSLANCTTIRVKNSQRKSPTQKQWDGILSELGFIYGPTIMAKDHSVSICSQWANDPPQSLTPFAPMTLGAPLREILRLQSGKIAEVYAIQLNPNFSNRHSGVQIFRKPRIAVQDSPLGTGQYSRSGIYAIVTLNRDWQLSTNKDSLDDSDDEDELDELLYEFLQPLLEKAQTSQLAIKDNQLSLKISDLLNEAYTRVPKSHPKDGPGPSKGLSGKGGAGKEGEGSNNKTKQQGTRGFIIKFENMDIKDGLGRRKGKVIELAKNHPFISEWLYNQDDTQAARILALQAFWILESSEEQRTILQNPELNFSEDVQENSQNLQSIHMPARVAIRLSKIYDEPTSIIRLVKNT